MNGSPFRLISPIEKSCPLSQRMMKSAATERNPTTTLDAEGFELHGWRIMKITGRSGPTVYKILERLSGAGLVSERWEDRPIEDGKPRRRYYRLTPNGVVRAQGLLAQRRSKGSPHPHPALGGGA
jgi:PadR family transcriptional regulator PadR